jgi:hypothetical protein
LATLRHVHPSLDTIEFWTGRSRRQAKSLKESFNGCARAADALLNKTPFKTILIGWIGSSEAATDLMLPHILRRWVGVLNELLSEVSGRQHLQRDFALALLVRYVLSRTKKPHDREIAALVSAVLDRPYATEAHQRWRRTRYPRLAEELARVAASLTPGAC